MNPYDFVRLDPTVKPPRGSAPRHNSFTGINGHIEGTITTLTPLFIPGAPAGEGEARQFRRNRYKKPIIPGSSLKGLMRSLVETIGPGCWWLLAAEHQDKLPDGYRQCHDLEHLCPACRLFGMMQKGSVLEGHVRFNDGVCENPQPYPTMFTPILSNPKPRHTAWYFAGDDGTTTGRKYFFHQAQVASESGLRTTRRNETPQNMEIAPIGAGSVFAFSAAFESVAEGDLPLLLYALVLEEGMRHKIGYAKPAGLGSIEIKLTKLQTRDMKQRYTAAGKLGGDETLEGPALAARLAELTAPFWSDTASITLNDLRRIWAWPPAPGVEYKYPSQKWFELNPRTPISETP